MKFKLHPIKKDGTVDVPYLPNPTVEDVCKSSVRWYKKIGFKEPWICYLAIAGPECVGTCAFKSAPKKRRVEIAYFTFPQHEGKKVATDMVRNLIAIASKEDAHIQIFAQTLPQLNGSTKLLKNLKFDLVGTVEHPEDGTVWEWMLND